MTVTIFNKKSNSQSKPRRLRPQAPQKCLIFLKSLGAISMRIFDTQYLRSQAGVESIGMAKLELRARSIV